MATEKEDSLPQLIDYYGDNEVEVECWNSRNVEAYWGSILVKKRKLSAHPFTIKTKTLAKRMVAEFDLEDLKEMINYWIETSKLEEAPVFEYFYTKRYEIKDRLNKDYSDWET